MTQKVSLPATKVTTKVTTKVITSKPAEPTTRTGTGRTRPGPPRPRGPPAAGLHAPAAVRRGRAASCPRRAPRGRGDGAAGARRSRSSAAGPGTDPDQPKGPASLKTDAAAGFRSRDTKSPNRSHAAFTVIPPDPQKRRDIQRKAEAELAALAELRLSRATMYVCVNPSSVGGCMSLEEVRLKQQQEVMRTPRKQQQTKEQTHVLMS